MEMFSTFKEVYINEILYLLLNKVYIVPLIMRDHNMFIMGELTEIILESSTSASVV